MDFLRPPFFAAIEKAERVLLAGAGGGYDIFCGVPLWAGLRAAGKTVHLANLSFSTLYGTNGRRIGEALVEVTHRTEPALRYFPELHLARWLHSERGESVPVYCFDRTGAAPVTTAYRNLVAHLGGVDAVILIDGGTDSLMRGDENGLGTPEEDVASLCAADALTDIPTRLLVCTAFGVDTYHGVCHAQFLEAVAALTAEGAYLGAWSLTPDMPEVAAYRSALEWVHRAMFNHPSIVNSSLLAAIEGRFGDHHATHRTAGSELFINPLMAFYWAFDLPAVARRNLYLDRVRDTQTYEELWQTIGRFRSEPGVMIQGWTNLPV
jgi:hypothetical protein